MQKNSDPVGKYIICPALSRKEQTILCQVVAHCGQWRSSLAKRGVQIASSCRHCQAGEETIEHVVRDCRALKDEREKLVKVLKLAHENFESIWESRDFLPSLFKYTTSKDIAHWPVFSQAQIFGVSPLLRKCLRFPPIVFLTPPLFCPSLSPLWF